MNIQEDQFSIFKSEDRTVREIDFSYMTNNPAPDLNPNNAKGDSSE